MGVNTLNNRAAGETIVANFFNDIHQAANGDFVGRNSSGVPTAGQNLGTAGLPWGTVRADTLILSGQAVDTSSIVAPANRIVSGKTRATAGSNLPQFLAPAGGASLQFVVDGSPTNLVLVINGASVTISTDITKSSLTAAPSTNNTCLVNDTTAADQYDTKFWGSEYHFKDLTVDSMGSEITALVGKWAAFKIAGVTDEYMLAYVESATKLSKCMRGFFYDSTLAPVKATGFSNNDTISLMKLTWVFAENDASTIDVTYNNPAWGFAAPGSPVTGDYWYDTGNNQWKRYDGSSFQVINRTFVGWVIQDTAGCVAARSYDFYADYKADNSLVLEVSTSEIVKAQNIQSSVNVAGTTINYGHDLPNWNITTDLAATTDMFDATEQASRTYFLFVKQNGDTIIRDIFPYFRGEFYGWYHPYNTWRCVGLLHNDASSDVVGVSEADEARGDLTEARGGNGHGSTNTFTRRYTTLYARSGVIRDSDSASLGTQFVVAWPGIYEVGAVDRAGGALTFGITRNGDGTVALSSNSSDQTIIYGAVPSGDAQPLNRSVSLLAGEVIMMQDESGQQGSDTPAVNVRFFAKRVGGWR